MSYDTEIKRLYQEIENKREELFLWTVSEDGFSDKFPTSEIKRIVRIYKSSIEKDRSELKRLSNACEELKSDQRKPSPNIQSK